MKWDELEFLETDSDWSRLVVVRDEQAEAGLVAAAGEEESPSPYDAQTR